MIRVLFVDDDTNLLQGLKRGLRRQVGAWEMEFVDSPILALDALNDQGFDVIVTDLQMPGMSGIELLKRVSEVNPEIVPIILSGQVNKALLMHSLKSNAHVLLKPCKMEELIAAVERSYTLRKIMKSERLQSLVSRLSELPSLSQTHNSLFTALEGDNTPVSRIVALIQEDVSIAAKVMQLANSAFFGHTRVAQLENAIRILGLTHIRLLVLASDVFLKIDHRKGANIDLSSLIRHSTNVGRFSAHIARSLQLTSDQCEAAHVAGLLHDIGKLILIKDMPREMLRVAKQSRESSLPEHLAESSILGCSHAEVGAYILGIWMLPDVILKAVVFHHRPLDIPTTQPTVLSAVYLDNILEHKLHKEQITAPEMATYEQYAKNLGVEDLLPQWEKALANAPSSE